MHVGEEIEAIYVHLPSWESLKRVIGVSGESQRVIRAFSKIVYLQTLRQEAAIEDKIPETADAQPGTLGRNCRTYLGMAMHGHIRKAGAGPLHLPFDSESHLPQQRERPRQGRQEG